MRVRGLHMAPGPCMYCKMVGPPTITPFAPVYDDRCSQPIVAGIHFTAKLSDTRMRQFQGGSRGSCIALQGCHVLFYISVHLKDSKGHQVLAADQRSSRRLGNTTDAVLRGGAIIYKCSSIIGACRTSRYQKTDKGDGGNDDIVIVMAKSMTWLH